MKKSDLDFWQGMAAHYTKFMRRSAPVYAEICNRIRPHLTRDMNVLELASGTGQLSFPLSPYVRLWEATDVSSSMIAEAKKRTGSSRLHFSVQDAAHLPYVSETFDVVIANALHILPEPDRVLREARRVLKPGGWLFAPTFVHAGGKLARLRTWGMERTGFRRVLQVAPSSSHFNAQYLWTVSLYGLEAYSAHALEASAASSR